MGTANQWKQDVGSTYVGQPLVVYKALLGFDQLLLDITSRKCIGRKIVYKFLVTIIQLNNKQIINCYNEHIKNTTCNMLPTQCHLTASTKNHLILASILLQISCSSSSQGSSHMEAPVSWSKLKENKEMQQWKWELGNTNHNLQEHWPFVQWDNRVKIRASCCK